MDWVVTPPCSVPCMTSRVLWPPGGGPGEAAPPRGEEREAGGQAARPDAPDEGKGAVRGATGDRPPPPPRLRPRLAEVGQQTGREMILRADMPQNPINHQQRQSTADRQMGLNTTQQQ